MITFLVLTILIIPSIQSTPSKLSENMSEIAELGLAHIEPTSDPFILYNNWKEEAKLHLLHLYVNAISLATVSKTGRTSNRNVYTLDEFKNRFVFVTSKSSKKFEDFTNNQRVAGTFLWHYKLDEKAIIRQVRIEGTIKELDRQVAQELFDAAPLFVRFRSEVCHQGVEVNYQEFSAKVHQTIEDVKSNNKILSLPDDEAAFEIVPAYIEFYDSQDKWIADRVAYTRGDAEMEWSFKHVEA